MQRADVTETDKDLEGTGLSRPKRGKHGPPEQPPEPPGDSSLDTEELMESAQSVRPKQKSTLYEDLHGQNNLYFLFLNKNSKVDKQHVK